MKRVKILVKFGTASSLEDEDAVRKRVTNQLLAELARNNFAPEDCSGRFSAQILDVGIEDVFPAKSVAAEDKSTGLEKLNAMQNTSDGYASLVHESSARMRLRGAVLTESNGVLAERKDALVTAIIDSFQDPSRWPMTDAERLDLLRSLYRKALCIRSTEAAVKAG